MSTEFESTGGIDPAAFGESLFETSGTPEKEEQANSPAALSTTPEVSPPAAPEVTPLSEPEPWEALPKSWKREMEAHWKASPAEVRRYAHEREQQVTHGISGYRQAADNWNKVYNPLQEVLKDFPDANLPEILSTLANNHVRMVKATPEERRQHALALARGYGVDLDSAPATPGGEQSAQAQGFSPAQLAHLERTFGPAMKAAQQAAQYAESQVTKSANEEVDRFFSDPKNEFVNDVADDILLIMRNNQAQTLGEAYELAVLRNPGTKARYIASLAPKPAAPPANKPQLPNVKSSATPAQSTKIGSMDDTLNSVLAKHYS